MRWRIVWLAAVRAIEELGRAGIGHERAADRLKLLLDQEEDPYIAFVAYWAFGAQGGSVTRSAAFRSSEWGQTVWEVVSGT